MPFATPCVQEAGHLGNQVVLFAHADTLAKYCYEIKQPIALIEGHDCCMTAKAVEKPINDVIADNLAFFMAERGLNQSTLAAASGIGQTTIGMYLKPSLRQPSKSGKQPSAKVTELAQIAAALGIQSWQLMREMTPRERAFYAKVEEAYRAVMSNNN